MIPKFPYTNLHELNLDWIIEQLIKIEQGAVLSVNGQTGEVVIRMQTFSFRTLCSRTEPGDSSGMSMVSRPALSLMKTAMHIW